jgi:hypothetical protein
MEQAKPTNAPDAAEAPNATNRPPALTLEILVGRMIQTQRDIAAYRNGKMTKEEFDAIGIKLF